ncbi:MAG: archaeosine biosynthesis radical SAM protein RaSEA [Thermoplasmata archaeon]
MTESVARGLARQRKPRGVEEGSPAVPVNLWSEPESLQGTRVPAFVAILRTRGCYWADLKGCSMCGYAKDTLGRSATPGELALQRDRILQAYRGQPYVKFYTSGSFLDDREVDPESRVALVRSFSGHARRLLFETLPEFATAEKLGPLREAFDGEIEVALGLESTQPEVLGRLINKGAPPSEYLEAADRIRGLGLRTKGYLLLKPPYLTEDESVADVLTSIDRAGDHFDTLSVNPVHIQNGTVVEWLFRRGRYRPPWLWSVVEVLSAGATRAHGVRLVSVPTAGGLPRGPHTCRSCDRRVLEAIEAASLDQQFEGLGLLDCPCRRTYSEERSLEPLGVEA